MRAVLKRSTNTVLRGNRLLCPSCIPPMTASLEPICTAADEVAAGTNWAPDSCVVISVQMQVSYVMDCMSWVANLYKYRNSSFLAGQNCRTLLKQWSFSSCPKLLLPLSAAGALERLRAAPPKQTILFSIGNAAHAISCTDWDWTLHSVLSRVHVLEEVFKEMH